MDIATIKELAANPGRLARRIPPLRAAADTRKKRHGKETTSARLGSVLTPAEALTENGFTVFRGLFSADECAQLAATMKREAGIKPDKKFMSVDAPNRLFSTRQVLFDERVLNSVRAAIGGQARFLQVSDLHYRHDTAAWHRDSVHRAHDSSDSADWSDGEYRVVKAILYMEADNAAMGFMCSSHLSPIEMDHEHVKTIEDRSGQFVIDERDEPNRRFTPAEKRIPFAWKAQVGDVLVFDERMYHAGRRVEHGKVVKDREAPKFTLSFVFGLDNMHSERLYSYFRYARRELHYRDFVPVLETNSPTTISCSPAGQGNYYLQHPTELRLVYLKNPESMEPLIEEFTREGAAASSA